MTSAGKVGHKVTTGLKHVPQIWECLLRAENGNLVLFIGVMEIWERGFVKMCDR